MLSTEISKPKYNDNILCDYYATFQAIQNLHWFLAANTGTYLNGVIRICNKCNKKAENHIYEKADEGIQVQTAEQPHQDALLLDLSKGGKHVITVDQGKQAFSDYVQIFKL